MSLGRRNRLKTLAIFLGSSLSAFAGLWTLLEPADGFSVIDRSLSREATDYILLVCVSLLIAGLVAFVRLESEQHSDDTRHSEGASRNELNIVEEVAKAERRLYLLGISLPSYSSEQSLRAYNSALAKGVQIDIIICNPFSPAPLQRPRRLYEGHETPPVTAARTLAKLVQFRNSLGPVAQQYLSIYVSSFLPTHGAMIVDDEVIWYPYLDSRTGVMSPYLRDFAPSIIARAITTNFEDLRVHSTRVDDPGIGQLSERLPADLADTVTLDVSVQRAVKQALGEEWDARN